MADGSAGGMVPWIPVSSMRIWEVTYLEGVTSNAGFLALLVSGPILVPPM